MRPRYRQSIGHFERRARERHCKEQLWLAQWTMRYGSDRAVDRALQLHNEMMDEAERLGFRAEFPSPAAPVARTGEGE